MSRVLAYDRVLQGSLKEGVDVRARGAWQCPASCPSGPRRWARRRFASGSWRCGEYEEGARRCLRGTELARKAQDKVVLWHNLDHLGRAYKALLDLKRRVGSMRRRWSLGHTSGPHYEAFSSASLCAVAALSEDWEEAYAHAGGHIEAGTSFDVLDGLYLHHEVEALLRGGDERLAAEEVRRFAERDRGRTSGNE